MDKLEVGKWYRFKGDLIKCIEANTDEESLFHRWEYDFPKREGRYNFSLWHDDEYLKPLETLTPSEALILLGNKFTLWHHEGQYKIFEDDGDLVYLLENNCGGGLWNGGFNDLTIHALPDGE